MTNKLLNTHAVFTGKQWLTELFALKAGRRQYSWAEKIVVAIVFILQAF